MKIIPAILPKNFEDLKQKISQVQGEVSMVQIDFCDGTFSRTVTWPFGPRDDHSLNAILNEEEGLPYWQNVNFEFDLMVRDAVENFDTYIKIGPSSVVFHLMKDQNIEEFSGFLEGIDFYIRENLKIGIAIGTSDDIEQLRSLISHVDFIQCMGVEKIGQQGAEFDERVLSQMKKLKELFPNIEISVDGAVNSVTAESLVDAGADRLVVGSAIFNVIDPIEAIREFEALE